MGVLFKLLAAVLIIGGLWFWASGKQIEQTGPITVRTPEISASAILATPDSGSFDQTGTIVIDASQGDPGIPYILYTTHDAAGKPSVKTKRLIFPGRPSCEDKALACATDQPPFPVSQDQTVRIIGTVEDETVHVTYYEHLSP